MFASRTFHGWSTAALSIAVAFVVSACDDLFVAPDDDAPIRVGLSLVAGSAAGGSAEAFDAVDRILVRILAGQEIVEEIEQPFDANGADVSVPISAPSQVDGIPITLQVELSRGADILFLGQGELIPDAAGANSAEIVLEPVAAAVLIDPPTALFEAFGDRVTFRAAAIFATGDTIDGVTITFHALTPGILELQPNGLATAQAQGTTRVEARYGGVGAGSEAEVRQRVTVIEVGQVPSSLAAGQSFALDATLFDRNGFAVQGRSIQWTSSDPAILVIDPNNVARAVGTGTVTVTGTVDDATTNFQVTVATIPITPSGLIATVRGTVVSLIWQDNADNETEYQVLWRPANGSSAFALVTSLAPNAMSFTGDTGSPDARFEYVVRACSGTSCSANSNAIVLATIPVTPASTTINQDSFTLLLSITWTDTNTETFFKLERDDFYDGNWVEERRPGPDTTGVDINASIDYYAPYALWRVFACNPAGCSPPTSEFYLYYGSCEPSSRVQPAAPASRRGGGSCP